MSDYLHHYPLDTARKEIRLLTILPALISKARIKCSLQVASLDAFPRYEAISYVWGDIREKQAILLDGRTIQVPTNVRRILQRLRHRMQRRVIWIDYVCINQDNVAEKNTQIPLMSAIYANATSVIAIISLDNLIDNGADAIDWMKRTSAMMRRDMSVSCWWIKRILSQISVGYGKRLSVSLGDVVDFYYDFLAAEYWTRMWTFQEYQLSQGKSPICICGDVEFPGPYGKDLLRASYWALVRISQMHYEAKEGERRPQLRAHYKDIKRHIENLHWTITRSFTTVNYRWVSDKQNLSVLDLLRQTSGRKCQDPKDKIYALYALLPSLQKAYPPDYNKSLSQIIFETARYILEREGANGFIMVDMFCLRKDRLEDFISPSWVPDLTTTLVVSTATETIHYSEKLSLVREINPTKPRHYPKFTADPSLLCILGRPIGKCKPVFQFASDVRGVLTQIMGVIQMHGDGRHVWDHVWEPENIPHRFLLACGVFSKNGNATHDINDQNFPWQGYAPFSRHWT
ncbi:hypothetical protein RU639_010313 [Aspergillus parasiticus]